MLLLLKMNYASGAALGVCFVMILIRYIFIETREYGFQRHRLGAAVALLISWTGGVGVCAATWAHLRDLHDVSVDELWIRVVAGCALVSGVGTLCCIRHFAPDDWEGRIWVVSGAIATIVAGFAWWW